MTSTRQDAEPTQASAARITATQAQHHDLFVLEGSLPPASGVSLYRLKQVLARIPVSRSAWFAGVQAGRYPRSYSLGPRTTVWRSDDIDQVIAALTRLRPSAASFTALRTQEGSSC